MYSNRLDWTLAANRISVALAARRSAGAPVLDLTESNPTAAGFDYPRAEILGALADPAALLYEPAPAGLMKARRAVSECYAARGLHVEPERVLITASTSEAYSHVMKLLASPGDQILVPRPSYPLFEFLACLESVDVVQYPLLYDHGWMIDFHRLEEAASPRARAMVLVNPNNPTGSYVKKQELEQIVEFCSRRGLALISDEVFAEFPLRSDSQRVESLASNEGVLTFSFSGLSKSCGLPQMKLGWIVVAGPRALRDEAFTRLELVADTYLSTGAPVQHALPRLLRAGQVVREQIRNRTAENLRSLRAAVNAGSACRVLDVEGGWSAVLSVPRVLTEEEWTLVLLEKDGVVVQPGYFFDFESEAYLVVSLLTRQDIFEAGLTRLLQRIVHSSG